MNNRKGFTLVELIIVIIIVGVLSIVAVPVYKGYTRKAMATEAKALLSSIVTAEKLYYAEYGHYKYLGNDDEPINYDKDLDVDSRSNKYFTGWGVGGFEHKEGVYSHVILFAGVVGNQGSGADNISVAYITYSSPELVGDKSIKPGFYEFYETEPDGFENLLRKV